MAVELDYDGIRQYIKIRYPVLMIDKATVEPGISSVACKYLTGNEAFWQGHYPDHPMMPGTYQLEAMAQTFSLTFLVPENPDRNGGTGMDAPSIPRLVGFEKVRFFKEVQPGHILEIRTELIKLKRGLAEGSAEAFIDNICACSADIRTMI